MTGDESVLGRISRLVDEEHRIRTAAAEQEGPPDAARLRTLEEELDQCWDLLRQRQARRSVGLDADGATARSTSTVENYLG